MKFADAASLHQRVMQDMVSAAESVPADRWTTPRAEGKWSPAEVLEHVSLAYHVMSNELAGGPPMRIKTKAWQRLLLRFTMVPKIMRGDGFPSGARSPKEIKPATANANQREAIDAFKKRAADFDVAVARAQDSGRRVRLTHAYFGAMTLVDSVTLLARHLEHHVKQMR